MNGNIGHIYVLSNPALQGMVKIGHTLKAEAERRAVELSASTSIPLPFHVEGSWLVEHPAEVELRIHQSLARFRVSKAREFFHLDVEDAISRINLLLFGVDTHPAAAIREMAMMAALYRKYPASFRHADDLVASMEGFIRENGPSPQS